MGSSIWYLFGTWQAHEEGESVALENIILTASKVEPCTVKEHVSKSKLSTGIS